VYIKLLCPLKETKINSKGVLLMGESEQFFHASWLPRLGAET